MKSAPGSGGDLGQDGRLQPRANGVETEQDPMVLPCHVLCLPFVCRKTSAKQYVNQRSEKMQKQRKAVKQDKIIII